MLWTNHHGYRRTLLSDVPGLSKTVLYFPLANPLYKSIATPEHVSFISERINRVLELYAERFKIICELYRCRLLKVWIPIAMGNVYVELTLDRKFHNFSSSRQFYIPCSFGKIYAISLIGDGPWFYHFKVLSASSIFHLNFKIGRLLVHVVEYLSKRFYLWIQSIFMQTIMAYSNTVFGVCLGDVFRCAKFSFRYCNFIFVSGWKET